MSETHLSVCVTCQPAGNALTGERPGAALHRAMQEKLADAPDIEHIRLHAVECLCVCTRPCTVAVSAAGKWGYIVSGLDATSDSDALLEYARLYAASPHGTPSLKQRPPAIRRGIIARIPPIPTTGTSS